VHKFSIYILLFQNRYVDYIFWFITFRILLILHSFSFTYINIFSFPQPNILNGLQWILANHCREEDKSWYFLAALPQILCWTYPNMKKWLWLSFAVELSSLWDTCWLHCIRKTSEQEFGLLGLTGGYSCNKLWENKC
jgi:hypothetical protein